VKPVFAMTTYGLETISEEEMVAVPGVTLTETGYRRIAAHCEAPSLSALLDLRTVDDVYLDVAIWDTIRHTRDALKVLEEHFLRLDLKPAAKTCATIRPISANPIFSVTASFIGKRNYNGDELKRAAAAGIETRCGWHYTVDDREADLNVRLFIVNETAYVGMRLGKYPLHERDYKRIERPGALKASVAAAMLKIARVQPGMRLLDPCCGTGTILIEGAQIGAVARGGDIEIEAVQAAQANITAAGVQAAVEEWDARTLALPDQSVDRIVSNLPWGRQIKVDDELVTFYENICREMERVLAPSGRLAVLTSLPDLLHFPGLQPEQTLEISLFGQRPTIAAFSVIP
jgi:tRNA (guanine6-N2)-methyltransferase